MRRSMLNGTSRSVSKDEQLRQPDTRSWTGQMQRGYNPYEGAGKSHKTGFRSQPARNVRDSSEPDGSKG